MSIKPIRKKWKSLMTDRERFNAQMNYKKFDRTFNMEFGYWEENYKIWQGFIDNNIQNERDANIFFGFDKIECIYGNIWLNPGFKEKILSETPSSKIIINSDGLIAEIPKDSHSTIPHFKSSSIKTPDDWKKIKEEHCRIDDPERIVDIERILKEHPENRDYPLGVYCGSMIGKIRDMLTFEGLIYAIYDYPEMVEDMVETSCRLVENFLNQVLGKISFDFAAGWEDICFKNGPIIPLDFFENVVVPRYQRIGKLLKDGGITLWYTDCDGDVRPLIPGFLKGGINCLFPFEVNSCCHPEELLSQYEGRLRIMGGFDKIQLIHGKDTIKSYMESLIPLVEKGGFIPFCDHRCPPDVKYEDYLYYLDLKEQIFGIKE